MADKPDLIKKHSHIDVHANHYNRTKMYQFLKSCGFDNPTIVYQQNEPTLEKIQNAQSSELGLQEVIVFERVDT
jgi:hypothetical protein